MSDRFEQLKDLLDASGWPALGPGPRADALPLQPLQSRLDEGLDRAGVGAAAAVLIRSLALLWHDHLDASHTLSQGIHTADGSYLHAIMHRREPDFGNAAYWFRRVGDHPVHGPLARDVAAIVPASEFRGRLIAGGRWNPLAMVDACEAVEVGAVGETEAALLREVQAAEFRLLLRRFCEL